MDEEDFKEEEDSADIVDHIYEDMHLNVNFTVKIRSIEIFPSENCEWKANIYFELVGYALEGHSVHQMEVFVNPVGQIAATKETICRTIEQKLHSSLMKLTAPKWTNI